MGMQSEITGYPPGSAAHEASVPGRRSLNAVELALGAERTFVHPYTVAFQTPVYMFFVYRDSERRGFRPSELPGIDFHSEEVNIRVVGFVAQFGMADFVK